VKIIAVGVVACWILARLLHRREHLRWAVQRTLILLISYGIVVWAASQLRRPTVETFLWGFIAMLLMDTWISPRSRSIRKTDRQKIISRWERKTGLKFDPHVHELDHIIPHAKGGDNAAYNLRVATIKENRSKGKKSPKWDIIGRWRD
jgi:HNH endonuclease